MVSGKNRKNYWIDYMMKGKTRNNALRRLKESMSLHLRVKKLNTGDEEPLNDDEQPLKGVTVENFTINKAVDKTPNEEQQYPVQKETDKNADLHENQKTVQEPTDPVQFVDFNRPGSDYSICQKK